MQVGIFVYEEAEVLDFSGPFEVFSTAARIHPTGNRFSVFLVGESGASVTARAGYRICPAHGFHDHPPIDLLVVPGGVHVAEMGKPRVLDWIARQAKSARIVASVCTGAFLLAAAGVLTTQRVTTHWEDVAELRRQFPALNVREGVRWVDEGRIVTSGGISAGIDMSLHLVARLDTPELAEGTARQMEFHWTRQSSAT
jgi:transcriptional regulator GlxA family with amidase domain